MPRLDLVRNLEFNFPRLFPSLLGVAYWFPGMGTNEKNGIRR